MNKDSRNLGDHFIEGFRTACIVSGGAAGAFAMISPLLSFEVSHNQWLELVVLLMSAGALIGFIVGFI